MSTILQFINKQTNKKRNQRFSWDLPSYLGVDGLLLRYCETENPWLEAASERGTPDSQIAAASGL